MRIFSFVARWALCACLLTITNPFESQSAATAQAQPKKGRKARNADKKSVRRCVKFQQTLGSDEESVDLQLTNNCKVEVVCSIEWDLQCAGSTTVEEEGKRASTLDFSETLEVNASAGACELDWEVKNVRWNCVAAEG